MTLANVISFPTSTMNRNAAIREPQMDLLYSFASFPYDNRKHVVDVMLAEANYAKFHLDSFVRFTTVHKRDRRQNHDVSSSPNRPAKKRFTLQKHVSFDWGGGDDTKTE